MLKSDEERLLEDWLSMRTIRFGGYVFTFPQGRLHFLSMLEKARARREAPVLEGGISLIRSTANDKGARDD
ncbi:MAG: hypothetical protein L0170_13715 [Acidobacteria bacterium]|nr:hypothetical protein [Acidobacteriota bacterium]